MQRRGQERARGKAAALDEAQQVASRHELHDQGHRHRLAARLGGGKAQEAGNAGVGADVLYCPRLLQQLCVLCR